ncbi:MAG: hypothetical protein GWP04_11850 [Gammaproteobacteria bacterium]|nr:hypothetical protein [Gammaproteobacteria bacterium]
MGTTRRDRGWGIRRAAIASIIALLLAACSIGTSDESTTQAQADVPVGKIEAYYSPIGSVSELAELSTAVLIGEFAGVKTEVFVQPPDSDEVMAGVDPLVETVYDGWVFRPVEWIKGGGVDELVVRVPSALRDVNSGKLISRLIPNSYPISEADVGNRYLLFLSDRYTKEYGLWNFYSSPYGAAEVGGDGRLKVADILTGTGQNPLMPYQGREVTELVNVLRASRP